MNAKTELVPRSLIDRVAKERELALSMMTEGAAALEAAFLATKAANDMASRAAGGTLYGRHSYSSSTSETILVNTGFDRAKALAVFKRGLDRNVWTHVLEVAGVGDMMDKQARDQLERSLAGDDVPEATEENLRATVEALFRDSDMIFKRGLANAFSKLDRRFRSHDGFKIGSRIILERMFDEDGWWMGSHEHTLRDVERVFAILDGEKPAFRSLREAINESRRGHYGPRQSTMEGAYFRLDAFKNGNAHLWFTRDDLVAKANRILAEWYGDVIGDADPGGKPEDLFNRSVVPATDLQFYPSPEPVIEELLDGLKLDGVKMLEPSAGTGAIATAALAKGAALVKAIEIDRERFLVLEGKARRSGGRLSAKLGNFLAEEPAPIYDLVVMNPPFAGNHYMDHITHAMKFLAPGGILRAVVPASAEVNESRKHEAFRTWAKEHSDGGWRGPFEDLPDGSFKDCGTMVNTCVLKLRKRR